MASRRTLRPQHGHLPLRASSSSHRHINSWCQFVSQCGWVYSVNLSRDSRASWRLSSSRRALSLWESAGTSGQVDGFGGVR